MELKFKEERHDHEMAEFNFGFVEMAYEIKGASDFVDLWRVTFRAGVRVMYEEAEILNEVIGKEAAIGFAQKHFENELKRLSA